mmetsp:Transcript_33282/g.71114  ORF Transcript_33282/g.71114 Transcript_33282/m.71114 type:complete len:653 (-) Transcript_33282:221-2179(-)
MCDLLAERGGARELRREDLGLVAPAAALPRGGRAHAPHARVRYPACDLTRPGLRPHHRDGEVADGLLNADVVIAVLDRGRVVADVGVRHDGDGVELGVEDLKEGGDGDAGLGLGEEVLIEQHAAEGGGELLGRERGAAWREGDEEVAHRGELAADGDPHGGEEAREGDHGRGDEVDVRDEQLEGGLALLGREDIVVLGFLFGCRLGARLEDRDGPVAHIWLQLPLGDHVGHHRGGRLTQSLSAQVKHHVLIAEVVVERHDAADRDGREMRSRPRAVVLELLLQRPVPVVRLGPCAMGVLLCDDEEPTCHGLLSVHFVDGELGIGADGVHLLVEGGAALHATPTGCRLACKQPVVRGRRGGAAHAGWIDTLARQALAVAQPPLHLPVKHVVFVLAFVHDLVHRDLRLVVVGLHLGGGQLVHVRQDVHLLEVAVEGGDDLRGPLGLVELGDEVLVEHHAGERVGHLDGNARNSLGGEDERKEADGCAALAPRVDGGGEPREGDDHVLEEGEVRHVERGGFLSGLGVEHVEELLGGGGGVDPGDARRGLHLNLAGRRLDLSAGLRDAARGDTFGAERQSASASFPLLAVTIRTDGIYDLLEVLLRQYALRHELRAHGARHLCVRLPRHVQKDILSGDGAAKLRERRQRDERQVRA